MKKILITGANSYIGTSFENYIKQWPEKYQVDTVDMLDDSWRSKDFSGYDVVYHVAGIAHQKETPQNIHIYYEINRDLAVETAKKSKAAGVGQFIFLSSMSVYGMDTGVITKNTIPNPKSNYGQSKIQAEKEINKLSDTTFNICILRPPMVYGKGCKGNYVKLAKLSVLTPIFPKVKNTRSMIYIDNLCEFIRLCIENESDGVFLLQNEDYVNTTCMVMEIAKANGRQIIATSLFNWAIKLLGKHINFINKIFGSYCYEKLEYFGNKYQLVDFATSIKLCEEGKNDGKTNSNS